MVRNVVAIIVISLALAGSALSQTVALADDSLVRAFLNTRQTVVEAGEIDTEAMSKTVRATVVDAERLEREGNYQAALDRLLTLQKYRPLPDLPSFDVQLLASWLYGKLGDPYRAKDHRARADAMRELLWRRIGKGDTPDNPVRVILVNDMIEWARSQMAQISNVKSTPYKGRELFALTYTGPSTGNQPKQAYFEIDPRIQARMNSQVSLFAPIPLAELKAEHLGYFNLAKEKRERFLNDDRFPYLELMSKIKESMAQAVNLRSQGKPAEALEKLSEVARIRPIEEIPMPHLISLYSGLNGQVGNTQKQMELRGLLFGINQTIAHSGDGLSPQTAIEVIAIDEEYAWLKDKKLSRIKQSILETGTEKYDLLTAQGTDGQQRDYYFNITRMYRKYGQGLSRDMTKQ